MQPASTSRCPSVLVPAFPATKNGTADISLPFAWWLLAVLALGASTLCAVLLVVARTPFLAHCAEFFRTALVLHVDLAVVIWFLAVAAGLWLKALPVRGSIPSWFARGGLWIAGVGVITILLASLDKAALPILANYMPVLDSSLFHLGLVAFLSGVGLTGLAVLASTATLGELTLDESWRWPIAAAVVTYLAAGIVFLLAWRDSGGGVSLDEQLWGGGHVLQIVHTLMLMSAWLYLGRHVLDRMGFRSRWLLVLIASELLAVLADLAIALVFPVDSPAYRMGFTMVMRWLTWPAPSLLAVALLLGYAGQAREKLLIQTDIHLIASIGLFLLGCLVGACIRGETTIVPAHYHGTVGALTLAYMVWARKLLIDFGFFVRQGWLWRWQPLVYGGGIGLMVVGLSWAGQLGVPRKAPYAEALISGNLHKIAMSLAGSGGLLATSGAAIFVLWIGLAIWKKRSA